MKSETIQIKKETLWRASTFILLALILGYLAFGGNTGNTKKGTIDSNRNSGQTGNAVLDMGELSDNDAFKGDKDAPVTIVEWSDYECPFCGRFYTNTLRQIEEQYVKTGKVKFVYRDFPLGFHPQAQKAAEAAECAGEQGKYFEMHDLLFEKGVSGGVTSFKQFASDIGLDTGKFNSCLDSGEMASEIAKDMKDGAAVGIQGTPGFIINGKLVSGAQPFSVFQAEIENALNN